MNLKTSVSIAWTPIAYWNSWANKSDGHVFVGYSSYSKWPPFSRTQARSNHWHSSRTRHCRTARSMMSWLNTLRQNSLHRSDSAVDGVLDEAPASEKTHLVTFLNYNVHLALKLCLPAWNHHTSLRAINNVNIVVCAAVSVSYRPRAVTCLKLSPKWHFPVQLYKLVHLRNYAVYLVETCTDCVQ